MAQPDAPKPPPPPRTSQEAPAARQDATKPGADKSPEPAPAAPQGAAQEPQQRWDEAVPGGKYEVGGRLVDAHGKPVSDKK